MEILAQIDPSDDLRIVYHDHNQGKGARYTAPRRPVELEWSESFSNRSLAQRREAEIKRWSRERKEMLIDKG